MVGQGLLNAGRVLLLDVLVTFVSISKYILHSKNIAHPGLPLHPLDYLTLYYQYERNDIEHLIDVADKFLTDSASMSIISWYKRKGHISFKQRKFLVWKLTNCYEPKEREYAAYSIYSV